MGKKKKYYGNDGMYDQKRNETIADHLLAYIDSVENLFILEGKDEDDIKEAIKVVRKACKHLKEGKPEKVYNVERFEEVYGDSM